MVCFRGSLYDEPENFLTRVENEFTIMRQNIFGALKFTHVKLTNIETTLKDQDDRITQNTNSIREIESKFSKISIDLLKSVLDKERLFQEEEQEVSSIKDKNNPDHLYKYSLYKAIIWKLNSVYMALSVISSQMVDSSEETGQGLMGSIGQILDKVSPHIPLAGLGVSLVGQAFQGADSAFMKIKLEEGRKNFRDIVEDSEKMTALSKYIARKIAMSDIKDVMEKINAKSIIDNLINVTKDFVDDEINTGIRAAIDTILNSDTAQTFLNTADRTFQGKGDLGNVTNKAFVSSAISTAGSAATNAMSAMRDGLNDAIQNGIKGIVQGIILNIISRKQYADQEYASGKVSNMWEYIKIFISKSGSSGSEEDRAEEDASEIVDFIVSTIFSGKYKEICSDLEVLRHKIIIDIEVEYVVSCKESKIENEDLCKQRIASVSGDITVTSEKVDSENSKVDDEGNGNEVISRNTNQIANSLLSGEEVINTIGNSDLNRSILGEEVHVSDVCSCCTIA